MDPPLISEGSFSTANPSLAEIWPFNGGGGSVNGGFLSGLIDGFVNNGGVGSMNSHRDASIDESTLTEQSGSLGGGVNGGRKRRENVSEDESSKLVSTTSSGNELKESDGKRIKTSDSRDENASSPGDNKPAEKPAEPPKDYIHVRARRGQATDSHSLAERARREKISERMKILQDLVPGCNKVIGKAIVLDEIINYIQSLQRQVEFLSMKLEAVNSGMIPSMNGFPSKDVNQLGMPSFDANGMMFGAQAAREFAGPQSEWLHMQLGGNFERTT